ncbi:MAG: GntR family transcriptional regulator [Pseudomonadota bacterium]
MSTSITDILPAMAEGPVSQRIYDRIREKIISLEWQPGVRISEKDAAAALGVSKTPVREAFIRLSEEGLMEIRPQSGSYVSEISFEKVYESLMLRRALEMAIAAEAANQRSAFDLVRLQDLIERQVQIAERGNGGAFFELDRTFHETLSEIARMPSAIRMIRMVRGTVDRVQRLRISRGDNRNAEVIGAHRRIVTAIERRDAKAASEAMDRHLDCMALFAQITRSAEVRKHVKPRVS